MVPLFITMQTKNEQNFERGDIYLVDSGAQYYYGTTDVTRTISLDNQNKKLKKFLLEF